MGISKKLQTRIAISILCALLGYAFFDYLDQCPVNVGDRVKGASTAYGDIGTVKTILQTGGLTQNCDIGVRWDNGNLQELPAWQVEKL